jgi:integrase
MSGANHTNGAAPRERPAPGAKEDKSMAQSQNKHRRSYGTGQLYVHTDAAGCESWYGRWYVGGERIKRKIGAKRQPGSRDGLTQAQAERELRRRIENEQAIPNIPGVTVANAGERLLKHLEAIGRKPTTIGTYRSLLKTHLVPHLGDQALDQVAPEQVERMMAAMRLDGAGPKLTRNAVALLYQVFEFGQRKGWCQANPCRAVDRPVVENSTDIRFLELEEVEALLRAVPTDDLFGETDRTVYLTATTTGLRQGELLALRWRDVDWTAGRIRVRQNYVRGHWGTPKTRRGSRSVPMTDRLAGELDRHFKRSAYQADDDLVFPHPETGKVLDHSALSRRFKKALRKAGIRQVRFHDLRHTFGTRMAASGVPARTLQEWMGHRDSKTTEIYTDYSPSAHESEMVERAFRGPIRGPKPSEPQVNSDDVSVPDRAEAERA